MAISETNTATVMVHQLLYACNIGTQPFRRWRWDNLYYIWLLQAGEDVS